MKMPRKNRLRLHKSMVPEDLDISSILKTGMVSNWKYVKKLEKKLKQIHKVKHALCFGSCTQAMMGIFYILKPETVAIPSFTWTSPKLVFDMMKIEMKYMDVNSKSYLVDMEEQEVMQRNNQPDLFVLTSTFGNKPHVRYPSKTILDSAHCGGHKGFGKLARAEVISFAPSKTFTGIEGGAVLTNDTELYEKLKAFRHPFSRMGEINAKVALFNLNRKGKIFRWKHKLFREYKKELGAWRFQWINQYSTLNEITACFPEFSKKDWEWVGERIELRKRYNPNEVGHKEENTVAKMTYESIMTLPTYLDADYKKTIEILKEAIKNAQ